MNTYSQNHNRKRMPLQSQANGRNQKFNIVDNRPSSIQMAKTIAQLKTCTITPGNKGTLVELELVKGETTGTKGSTPSVDPDGWKEVQTLKRTGNGAGSVDQKFLKFHLWNHNAGGPGDNKGNLTTTTGRANNNSTWNPFEKDLKQYLPAGVAKADIKSKITAEYDNTGTTTWKKNGTQDIVTTNNNDYPSAIKATLEVDGVQKHNLTLNATHGVYGPEALSAEQVPGFTQQ